MAVNLFTSNPSQQVRVIGNKNFAPFLPYFNIGGSVGSYYWPNVSGVRDNAIFLADGDGEDAKHIAQQRGLNVFISTIKDSEEVDGSIYALTGNGNNEMSLAYRITQNPLDVPYWLTPKPMFMTKRLREYGIILYSIQL